MAMVALSTCYSRRPSPTLTQSVKRRTVRLATAAHSEAQPSAAANAPSSGRGAGVVVVPGFLSGASSYQGLAASLGKLGSRHVEVVPISRWDWYPTLAGAPFDRLLDKIDATVTQMHKEHGQVSLVCHSAGGFLARILLGPQPYCGKVYGRHTMVRSLVTLGTPHLSLEAYPFGRVPESRPNEDDAATPEAARTSSLVFANHFYPRGDSFGPGTDVSCVVGRTVEGSELPLSEYPRLLISGGPEAAGERLRQSFAFSSYKANCGKGDVWGDGVTPLECAQLQGADNLVMEGVWHSPGSVGPWYGDLEVADEWSRGRLIRGGSPLRPAPTSSTPDSTTGGN